MPSNVFERPAPAIPFHLRDFAKRVRTTTINWDIHEDLYQCVAKLGTDLA